MCPCLLVAWRRLLVTESNVLQYLVKEWWSRRPAYVGASCFNTSYDRDYLSVQTRAKIDGFAQNLVNCILNCNVLGESFSQFVKFCFWHIFWYWLEYGIYAENRVRRQGVVWFLADKSAATLDILSWLWHLDNKVNMSRWPHSMCGQIIIWLD